MSRKSDSKGGNQRIKRDPLFFQIQRDPGLLSTRSMVEAEASMDVDEGAPAVRPSDISHGKIMKAKIDRVSQLQRREEENVEGFSKSAASVAQRLELDHTVLGEDQPEEYSPCDEEHEEPISAEDMRMIQEFEALEKSGIADGVAEELQKLNKSVQAAAMGAGAAFPEKVVKVYAGVGAHLSHYRSGKLPKAFKIIPSLGNWQEVLALTTPEAWSSQAVSAATVIFASGLSANMAQIFFYNCVLPKVRENIAQYRKLNYHLYEALRRSLYKPAAFFKGILLPMASDGMNKNEAVIISGLLKKASIPSLHSAVALLKLCTLEKSNTNLMIIKALLDKKYAFPRRVIQQVAAYLLTDLDGLSAEHMEDPGTTLSLPVIWHQAVLVFVQRYHGSLNPEIVSQIKSVVKVHCHHIITFEIKRELADAQRS